VPGSSCIIGLQPLSKHELSFIEVLSLGFASGLVSFSCGRQVVNMPIAGTKTVDEAILICSLTFGFRQEDGIAPIQPTWKRRVGI
jgi:hypothetical protein